jgi:hypothetical protein
MFELPITSDAEWFSMKMITSFDGTVALTGDAAIGGADGAAVAHADKDTTRASGASLRIVGLLETTTVGQPRAASTV